MFLAALKPAISVDVVAAIRSFIQSRVPSEQLSEVLTVTVSLALTLLLCHFVSLVVKRLVMRWVEELIRRSKVKWDDLLLKWRVPAKLAPLAPALVFYALIPAVLSDYPTLLAVIKGAAAIYMIIVGLLASDVSLEAVLDFYQSLSFSRNFPLKTVIQVLKIALYFVGVILIVSVVANKSPIYLLSGMGALTAVLMLIFKDPILGFVAGVQLSRNHMVALGDWIEMPKYNADGNVIDLALTTVKVQNWDNTVTTIPAYALISDSFKNWRYMSESAGRRIKRSVNIDLASIRFCSEEMLRRFEKITYISEYIEEKQKEIKAYNDKAKVNLSSLANGRRMTNIGVFRAYVLAYLKHHPMINQDVTLMVRQLAPTPNGLPIEIYCFSKDKEWVSYEAIQSGIFDHILSVVPEFDLRVYQTPSGNDLTGAVRQLGEVEQKLSGPDALAR